MCGCIIGQFVPTQTISKASFRGDSTFREQLERAVNGRVTDAFVAGSNFAQQVFDGRVRSDLEERIDDETSLRRRTQALLQHVALQPRPQTIDGDFVFRHDDVPPACTQVEPPEFRVAFDALRLEPQYAP